MKDRQNEKDRKPEETKGRVYLSVMEQEANDPFREEYAEEFAAFPPNVGKAGKSVLVNKTAEEINHTKKKYRLGILLLFLVSFLLLLAFCFYKLVYSIPDKVRIMVNETEEFDFKLPVRADFSEENIGVLSVNESNIPSGSLHLNLQNAFTIRAEETGSYKVNLKLFGFISLKQISLDVLENLEVVPCGKPIGITIKTKGALVLGTGIVTSASGSNLDPAASVLQTGDYIIAVNGRETAGKEELIDAIQNAKEDSLLLTIIRGEKEQNIKVKRIQTAAGDYKIGVWVRDDTQGIGTLTYITTNGTFGALGHGISDVDTGVLMDVDEGAVYEAEIISITKGKAGTPGELTGVIRKSDETKLGEVTANTPRGIFGRISFENGTIERLERQSRYGIMDIGLRQEVKKGPASILCQVDGELREYAIEIEDVDYGNAKQSKGLVIHITDRELIEKTGGIVQGMSGSPILQNGKLIGAVTHVFVRDATRGYGTFIENMLE